MRDVGQALADAAAPAGTIAPTTGPEGPAPVGNAQPVEPKEAAGNPYATPSPATEAPVER